MINSLQKAIPRKLMLEIHTLHVRRNKEGDAVLPHEDMHSYLHCDSDSDPLYTLYSYNGI